MSKIQIESNSQRSARVYPTIKCCIYHVKDTNRKQFTTNCNGKQLRNQLYLSCQRYKSKAIHNSPPIFPPSIPAVFIMSKIQIESNSQPHPNDITSHWRCIYHVKDTNRKQFTTRIGKDTSKQRLYLSCQRYKSKAIHNNAFRALAQTFAVFIMSKIQIESNSQQSTGITTIKFSCIYHVKDTNRKQFTTSCGLAFAKSLLYLSCQRYKSKAIHNCTWLFIYYIWAVFIMSKIQIESNSQRLWLMERDMICCIYHVKDTNRKQFTTASATMPYRIELYLSCQRYKSKAIHNGSG